MKVKKGIDTIFRHCPGGSVLPKNIVSISSTENYRRYVTTRTEGRATVHRGSVTIDAAATGCPGGVGKTLRSINSQCNHASHASLRPRYRGRHS